MKRRQFLEQTGRVGGGAMMSVLASGAVSGAGSGENEGATASGGRSLAIISDPADPVAAHPQAGTRPAGWAIAQLQEALAARGIAAHLCERIEQAPAGAPCLLAAGCRAPAAREILDGASLFVPEVPEALALAAGKIAGRPVLLAGGSDTRGLVYALLEVADRVAHARDPLAALDLPHPLVERPANPIRSVARLFVGEVEDKPWFYDRSFWPRYLSMLAAQRFNRFSLTFGIGYDFLKEVSDAYLHFAYPFLLAVPDYKVRAVGLPDEERDRNLSTLRFISEAAAARGLHFQLGLWTHGYDWAGNPGVNYLIDGLTPENHAAYCRDALRMLLETCPAIRGVTFRIHGESGVPEAHYDFWKTVFEGIVQCGRKVEIDMHAKGIDQRMIDVALATGMPVNVSPKFWAEHMGLPYQQAAIRALELPPREKQDEGFFAKSSGSRRFLRYGYGDLLAEDRRYGVLYRVWPGTQRLLLWGDPAMAAANGRAAGFCGSLGMELCEPLSFKGRKGSGLPGGRDAYANAALKPAGGDWEKYRYTYRLCGPGDRPRASRPRLYNPGTPPEVWRRSLQMEFGAGTEAVEAALAHASRILPLVTTAHLPSAANNSFWPELYTNMPIVDATRPHPYGDTPSPKRFGTVSPLDPELFSTIEAFAAELLEDRVGAKYSPLDVAQWLQEAADSTAPGDRPRRFRGPRLAEAEGRVPDRRDPRFRRLAVDVVIQSGMGRFFAAELRAGVLWALYERGGDETARQGAIRASPRGHPAARTAWAELAGTTEGVYARDITFGRVAHLRGHWADRLAAIDQDLADMEARKAPARAPDSNAAPHERVEKALRAALPGTGPALRAPAPTRPPAPRRAHAARPFPSRPAGPDRAVARPGS